MKINHEVFLKEPKNKKEAKQIFFAKCGIASEFAEMSFDRKINGEKYTKEGLLYTNKRVKEFGYGNIKRFTIGEDKDIVDVKTPNCQVLCFHNDDQIVVAFRGTYSKDGWKQNWASSSKTSTAMGEMGKGWYDDVLGVFNELMSWITSIPKWESKKLIITGHSKGAAESQIFSAFINSKVAVDFNCAIGCPKPFSDATAKFITKLFNSGAQKKYCNWRMVWVRNNNDIVTRVPLEIMNAEQGGKMIYIGAGTWDRPGGVFININPIHMWLDGVIFGRIFGRTKFFKYDSIEDHHPCYYINSFYKACGSKRKLKRWDDKHV